MDHKCTKDSLCDYCREAERLMKILPETWIIGPVWKIDYEIMHDFHKQLEHIKENNEKIDNNSK